MFGSAELKDMWKALYETIAIGVFAGLFGIWLIWFVFSYSSLKCDYKTIIEVDDSSKVELAISNAVNDVKSRNFVVIKLDVETWHDKQFRVTCGGIDRGNLLRK